MAYIDNVFRGYGEEFFGKEAMDRITDEQIEEARCQAFRWLAEKTEKYGKQEEETLQELFCNYIWGTFM